jgi:hypothetical protein
MVDKEIFVSIFLSLFVIFVIYYVTRHYIADQVIHHYVPIPTIEEHFIHVPVEDQIDLDLEDKHNVHNKTLKRQASHAISQLRKTDQHQYTIDQAIEEIKYLIEFNLSPDIEKLDEALYAVEKIDQMDVFYHSGQTSEKEILRLVWERINHPVNHKMKDQLCENLIDQLADCKNDYTGVHCCEGRIMRILQTLELCDDGNVVNLKPLWAYREEISNKILKYREKLLNKAPSKYITFNDKTVLDTSDRHAQQTFNQCLITNLKKRFTRDYVEKGILTQKELEDLTRVYYDSLYD